MAASLSFRPNMLLVLSPFVDRTGPPNPLLNRTQFSGFSAHRPFLRGSLPMAKFGFKPGLFPEPDAYEGVIRELFTKAESVLYTIADAAVSSSDTITTTTSTKQNDWLSGITNSLETILKVLKDGLSALHVPYAYGFAIILLTVLVKAATFPLTRKQVESAMAMRSLQPQIKAIQQRYAGDQERIQLETARLYKLAGINPLAGCLPTLATIPVWIGLYRALSNVANEGLLTEGFFWIPSLAGPTTIAARQNGSGISWLFPFVWLQKLGGAKNPAKQLNIDIIKEEQLQLQKSLSELNAPRKEAKQEEKLTPEGLRPGERFKQLKKQEARRKRQREEEKRKAQEAAAKADQLTNEGHEIEGSTTERENGAGTGLSIEKNEKCQPVSGQDSSNVGIVNGDLSNQDLKEDQKNSSSSSKNSESLEHVKKEQRNKQNTGQYKILEVSDIPVVRAQIQLIQSMIIVYKFNSNK
ncbi:OxaA/YidC-like membrane insertion protein isoform 4 [Theobroma cacao]|uniref:OxaA/YidC-like membrane insertion protein isoform 4 n=1 Tax=Theobroma cacao TaxID=3641 RepID=A0A061E731_THECC|nr:OxaA/YidC-like membrane insertion protein isoform 4 [Theobroma cacao]